MPEIDLGRESRPAEDGLRTARLTFAQAANAALRRALEDHAEVILFGEDVAAPGGIFGVTKGLRQEFGDRVFDTPISESAILGAALGAAIFGLRPVVEIMWTDFSLVALDQLVNQAANTRYVSRGRLSAPMVVRMQQGTQPGACAQHSQSLEALFAHIPGLRVCMPATAQDAYDLLMASIACDDPVVVIENRNLYQQVVGEVTLGGPAQRPGGAIVRRSGTDMTIVTWSAAVHPVLEAAELLAQEGISLEVVDLRWLDPFDVGAVVRSVERTGRLGVAHEANRTGGFGAEVVARVAEAGVVLRHAPIRLATPDMRIPAAPSLLGALVPTVAAVVDGVRWNLGRDGDSTQVDELTERSIR
jgi:acetoin:2,6-dichlorophenolindophenol oxidoreductase subunit beta